MSALEDEKSYTLWIGRKATTLRRARLDCGHPNTGEVFYHALCDRLSCSDECAKAEHDCAAYAGARSSTEEMSEPRPLPPEMAAAVARQPRCDVCNVWVGSGEHRCARCVAAGRRVPGATSPWVSFADVAAGPVAGVDSAVDVRRRVQDGTAPAPDRVAEAFRDEVLRQGLTECEIDGQQEVYRAGAWQADAPPLSVEALRSAVYAILDEPLRPTPPPILSPRAAALYNREMARLRAEADQPEPVPPHLDELEEPTYRRYECPRPGCDWVRVTLDLDVFDGVLAEHERAKHAVEPDPDVHTRPFKFTDLFAALRARARRGGAK